MPNACDYSMARPDPEALVAAGFVGVVRYTFDGTLPGKGITPGEYSSLRKAGLHVTLVCESGPQPAMRGTAGGLADARESEATAATLMWDGQPYDGAIYYVAEDPTRLGEQEWATVAAYFRAVKTVNPARTIGAYGSQALIQYLMTNGLADLGFQVGPWSTDTTGMHLCQQIGAVPAQFIGQIDLDVVLQDNWGQSPQPTGGTTLSDISDAAAEKVADLVILKMRQEFQPGQELFGRTEQADLAAQKEEEAPSVPAPTPPAAT